MSAAEIAAATGGDIVAGGTEPLRSVSTDSRAQLDGGLFVALAGERFDGHDYVVDALERGATGALVGRGWWEGPGRAALEGIDPPAGPVVAVEDTLVALGELAAWNRRRHDVKVIAVTGSNGKTTVKEMIASILRAHLAGHFQAVGDHGGVLHTAGNFNNLIGMPLTMMRLSDEHLFAVIEMGMNAPGEIARMAQIARPDVGVITNVQRAHLGGDGLGSVEAIGRAKGELYEGLPVGATMVVNAGNSHCVAAADRATEKSPQIKRTTFGTDDDEADVRVVHVVALSHPRAYTRVTVALEDGMQLDLRLPQLGRHNAMNAAAAAAATIALGVSPEKVAEGLSQTPVVDGRLLPRSVAGLRVLDDTYNANPGSAQAALDVLRALAHGAQTGVALGEMLELGGDAARLHRELGLLTVNASVRTIVAMGNYAKEILEGAEAAAEGADIELQTLVTDDPKDAAAFLHDSLPRGAWILVKGSRGARMERVVTALEELDAALEKEESDPA